MASAFFDKDADLPAGLAALFEKSTVSLALADCSQPDLPLIAVNQPFLDLSGYSADEVIGHNCRFLQPPGGPGPVRERMREFIANSQESDARFLVPNVTKTGTPFLNLIYMTRLVKAGKSRMILGSQFRISPGGDRAADLYDKALVEDLRHLNLLTSESNWAVLGTFEALASSNSIIAQMRFEE